MASKDRPGADKAYKQGAPGGRCLPTEINETVYVNLCVKCGSTNGTFTARAAAAGNALMSAVRYCSGCATDRGI